MNISNELKNVAKEIIGAGRLYVFYCRAMENIQSGKATLAEKKFLESLYELIVEYQYQLDVGTMTKELKELVDMRRELNAKQALFQKKLVLLKSKGELN